MEELLSSGDVKCSSSTPNRNAKEYASLVTRRARAGGIGRAVTRESTKRMAPMRRRVSRDSLKMACTKR